VARAQDHELSAGKVRAGLANFHQVYAHLKPFERQELIWLVPHRAVVGDRELILEIYEGACAAQARKSDSRFEPPNWLPDVDSNHEHPGSVGTGSGSSHKDWCGVAFALARRAYLPKANDRAKNLGVRHCSSRFRS
jgi:hypothetical protein